MTLKKKCLIKLKVSIAPKKSGVHNADSYNKILIILRKFESRSTTWNGFFMNYINPNIIIKESKELGKGIFAKTNIAPNSLIEISPVIVLSENDTKLIHQTHLHDYYFSWGEDQKKSAIALGYISLYNHSSVPNCYHECNFKENTISIFSKDKIQIGEELFIDYNMGEEKELWFKIK